MEKSNLYERIKELKDLSRQQKDELRKLRLVTSVSVNVLLVVIIASIGFFTRQDSWFSGITHFLIIFIQVLLNYLFALSLHRGAFLTRQVGAPSSGAPLYYVVASRRTRQRGPFSIKPGFSQQNRARARTCAARCASWPRPPAS